MPESTDEDATVEPDGPELADDGDLEFDDDDFDDEF